ncbi:tyrosine-type recombinase/integrase [Acetobacter ascendens]|uniref:Putative lambdoid prophage Rac integrase n=1 Tax=Acetobacter ascendens TaxID=481146 RepID=A0A1Y0V547_9PROT|nr:site-specific integrase [Acetobacter ascendens]ARW09967.1 Putative lambdoid prophage Rac integrase [Acetobacter ascendens]
MARASVRKRNWVTGGKNRSAWVVDYTDEMGNRTQKSFKLKKEADLFRSSIVVDVLEGRHVSDKKSATMERVAQEFIDDAILRSQAGHGVGELYRRGREGYIRNHILPVVGDILQKDLGFNEGDAIARKMAKAGYKKVTIREVLNTARQVCEFGIKRGYAKGQPFDAVLKDWRGGESDKIATFSIEQIQQLIKTVDIRQPNVSIRSWLKLRIFVHSAVFCGLRFGEISGITVQNVDLQNGILRIRNSLTSLNELKGPKTRAGFRDVPMPQHVRALFTDWLDHHLIPDNRNLLFCKTQRSKMHDKTGSKGITRADMHEVWRNLLIRAGLETEKKGPSYHFHALRHFAASAMVGGGMPVTDVAKLLGHASFDMTLQRYAHPLLTEHKQQAEIQKIASLMLPETD